MSERLKNQNKRYRELLRTKQKDIETYKIVVESLEKRIENDKQIIENTKEKIDGRLSESFEKDVIVQLLEDKNEELEQGVIKLVKALK